MVVKDKLKDLFSSIMTATEGEVACDDCFDELDKFAEMYAAGSDAATLLPYVERHLSTCGDCREEYQALLTVLRSEVSGESQ